MATAHVVVLATQVKRNVEIAAANKKHYLLQQTNYCFCIAAGTSCNWNANRDIIESAAQNVLLSFLQRELLKQSTAREVLIMSVRHQ